MAFGIFIRFYQMDPLDMSYSRFSQMFKDMAAVENETKPKSEIQMALEEAEARIRREQVEMAIEKGIDVTNPLFDPSEMPVEFT